MRWPFLSERSGPAVSGRMGSRECSVQRLASSVPNDAPLSPWRLRWQVVVLGSRAAEKGKAPTEVFAARLTGVSGAGAGSGAAKAEACEDADVVLLAIPLDGHDELVATLPMAGKVVLSCVNPLAFDKAGPYGRVIDGGEGSAAESAQRIVPDAAVVGVFHHVSAVTLWREADYLADEDVLVCGDSAEAKQVVIELARCVTGRDGIDAGQLRMARQLEPLTANSSRSTRSTRPSRACGSRRRGCRYVHRRDFTPASS